MKIRGSWILGLVVTLFVGLLIGCGSNDTKVNEKAAGVQLAAGLAAHQAGDIKTATTAYRETLRLDPKNKFAYYNLGVIEQAANHMEGAETLYRLSLNIDPKFPSALFNLALVRAQLGARDEAIDLYKQLLAIDDKNAVVHLNLGGLLLVAGKKDESEAEIKRAFELNPQLAIPVIPPAGSTNSGGAQP